MAFWSQQQPQPPQLTPYPIPPVPSQSLSLPVPPAPPGTYRVARASLPARTFISGSTGDVFDVSIPSNAIALLSAGLSGPTSMVSYGLFILNALDTQKTSGTSWPLTAFTFINGNKAAVGCFPVSQSDISIQATTLINASGDAGISYTPDFYFLVGPSTYPLPAVPITPNGSSDVIVSGSFTSATNSAQTVNLAPIGNIDSLELLAAWFYTSAGTATGNLGFFDGTTRVDTDTTAAVASYAFNVGKLGRMVASSMNSVTIRAVIGTAGVGNTTTFVRVYRAGVQRG